MKKLQQERLTNLSRLGFFVDGDVLRLLLSNSNYWPAARHAHTFNAAFGDGSVRGYRSVDQFDTIFRLK